jgi:Collagen triple helix repeat (20 copies)
MLKLARRGGPVVILLVLAAAGAVAVANSGGSSDVIHACVQYSNGNVRIVGPRDRCGRHEERVEWNRTGPRGPAGPQGPAGPAGPAGAMGPMGPVGPKGATGAAGPAGAQGPAGATGPAGPAGPMGATGPAGAVGPAGPQGVQGLQGLQGPAGPQGPKGDPGTGGSAFFQVVDSSATPLVLGPVIGLEGGTPLVGFKANNQVFVLRLEFGNLNGGLVYFRPATDCSGDGFLSPSTTVFRAASVDTRGRVWVEDPAGVLDDNFVPGSYVWNGECFPYDASFGSLVAMPGFLAMDLVQQYMQPFHIQ